VRLRTQKLRLCSLAVVAAGLMLALLGTASAADKKLARKSAAVWEARTFKDEFSDASWCRVQPRALTTSNLMPMAGLARPRALTFPYVERRGDQLRVGVTSAGGIQLPTGEVQLRIDQHPAQTISPSETPIDTKSPAADAVAAQMKAMAAANPGQTAIYEQVAATAASNFSQMMSPYTATTGEKANGLLAQMRGGQEIIYRGVGLNTAATTTGKLMLGDDFRAALAGCGL